MSCAAGIEAKERAQHPSERRRLEVESFRILRSVKSDRSRIANPPCRGKLRSSDASRRIVSDLPSGGSGRRPLRHGASSMPTRHDLLAMAACAILGSSRQSKPTIQDLVDELVRDPSYGT